MTTLTLVAGGAAAPGAAYPVSAPHDAALAALPREWNQAEMRQGEQASVAWRVAGDELVAVTCLSESKAQVRVFATANNRLVASLDVLVPNPGAFEGCAGQRILVSWSPNGREVLITNPAMGALHVWTPQRA